MTSKIKKKEQTAIFACNFFLDFTIDKKIVKLESIGQLRKIVLKITSNMWDITIRIKKKN